MLDDRLDQEGSGGELVEIGGPISRNPVATICWCAVVSLPSMTMGSISNPREESSARACAYSFFLSMTPPRVGSRPRKMLWATSRFAQRLSSWWINAIPLSRAFRALAKLTAAPSRVIVP